ncbi:MAG: hypothetical protein JSV95_04985 [Gemmatimonadota bacterium]|jgi:hypothetical protein|nr:MAG: hypothetical protein JSV95_04985 [Gemmatimonadota bacterium]
MTNAAQDREVRSRVETALRQLSVLDRHLLAHDANERALRHRFAVHIERHFDHWDVDCEYDLFTADPARLTELERGLVIAVIGKPLARDTFGLSVFPDIIVHHRKTDDNLLAIEVRKSTSPIPIEVDRAKLALWKEEPLAFRYACLVRLETGEGGASPYSYEFV